MDKATQTFIENLHKTTGKTLEQWIEIVKKENLSKHGVIVKFLKDNHSFTHGYANLVAHKTLGSDAGSAENTDDLITKQYQGKEHLKIIYDRLLEEIAKFGDDIEIAPKNAYVSLRRKKQFALLQPATKTRFEVGLMLKNQAGQGILEEVKTANAMCSHKILLSSQNDINDEVIGWIRKSYDISG